jgi:hypothetical protein
VEVQAVVEAVLRQIDEVVCTKREDENERHKERKRDGNTTYRQ